MKQSTTLARKITLPMLVLYGLGTILGAGIYVLVGKVAGAAGAYAPLSFVVAALIATITAFSYCDLVKYFPRSAGEVIYVQEGIGWKWLSRVVGCLVVFGGVVSSATIANGFVGYLDKFVELPPMLVIVILVIVLCRL